MCAGTPPRTGSGSGIFPDLCRIWRSPSDGHGSRQILPGSPSLPSPRSSAVPDPLRPQTPFRGKRDLGAPAPPDSPLTDSHTSASTPASETPGNPSRSAEVPPSSFRTPTSVYRPPALPGVSALRSDSRFRKIPAKSAGS